MTTSRSQAVYYKHKTMSTYRFQRMAQGEAVRTDGIGQEGDESGRAAQSAVHCESVLRLLPAMSSQKTHNLSTPPAGRLLQPGTLLKLVVACAGSRKACNKTITYLVGDFRCN